MASLARWVKKLLQVFILLALPFCTYAGWIHWEIHKVQSFCAKTGVRVHFLLRRRRHKRKVHSDPCFSQGKVGVILEEDWLQDGACEGRIRSHVPLQQ
jgi:hypothetical protein